MLARVILLVENRVLRRRLVGIFRSLDVIVDTATTVDDAWRCISRENSDFILVELSWLSARADLLALIRELPDAPDVIVVSEREDPHERAALLSQGCAAVLFRDLPTPAYKDVLASLVERRRGRDAAIDRGRSLSTPRLSDFVSESETMRTFLSIVDCVKVSSTTLLILGETGVGKERLAQAVHYEGPRAAGPFVPVNCAALTESLLESELFGHEEGAFTGATRSRRGCFEAAHRGTLFLDEIGEMPPHLQVKLLRVLQQREVQRVGGERTIPVDVRVMAASNRDIEADVAAGRFRQDLYYRLSVVTLRIPPLRERAEDIPGLVQSYIAWFRTQMPHRATGISPEALQGLSRYGWPGNVRELINVIERALLLSRRDVIGLHDLPHDIARRAGDAAADLPARSNGRGNVLPDNGWLERPLSALLADVERAYLEQHLRATGGHVGATAHRAGLNPRVLYGKMKRLGLDKADFRG